MTQPGAADDAALSYEKALELFDERLRALEEGSLSLEQALAAVEEARRYLLICESRLEEAKGRLETRQSGTPPPPAEGPGPARARIVDAVRTNAADDDDQPEIPF